MEELYLNDIEDLAAMVMDNVIENRGVAVYASREVIDDLVKELIFEEPDISFGTIEMNTANDEFLLELQPSDWEIWVAPATSEESRYVGCDQDVYFVEGSIGSSVKKVIPKDSIAFIFGFDSDCDGDCENCDLHIHEEPKMVSKPEVHTELSKSKDGKLKGFTQSGKDGNTYWSRSYYATDPNSVQKELNNNNSSMDFNKNFQEAFDSWERLGQLFSWF